AHHLPGEPKLAADRLDRLLLGEIGPTDLRDRLHYQHPPTGSQVPHGSHCGPAVAGVPIGCRSPRKRGPYSMRIHSQPVRTENDNGYIAPFLSTNPAAGLENWLPELVRGDLV